MTLKTDIINLVSTKDEIRARWIKFANDFFVEWRGPTRKTISDLAREMDLPRSNVSQSMGPKAKVPTEIKSIFAWVKIAGPIVYDILEIPRPESDEAFSSLPPEAQAAGREIREAMAKYSISPDSEEAKSLREEIMRKYGFTKNSTK